MKFSLSFVAFALLSNSIYSVDAGVGLRKSVRHLDEAEGEAETDSENDVGKFFLAPPPAVDAAGKPKGASAGKSMFSAGKEKTKDDDDSSDSEDVKSAVGKAGIVDDAKGAVKDAIDSGTTAAANAVSVGIDSLGDSAGDAVKSGLSGVADYATNMLPDWAKGMAGGALQGAANTVGDMASGAIDSAANWASEHAGNAVNSIGNWFSGLFGAGKVVTHPETGKIAIVSDDGKYVYFPDTGKLFMKPETTDIGQAGKYVFLSHAGPDISDAGKVYDDEEGKIFGMLASALAPMAVDAVSNLVAF